MILENLEKITNQLHKHAEKILTVFPTIYPDYSKGVHLRTHVSCTVKNQSTYRIFCTASAGFRHTPYSQIKANGYDFSYDGYSDRVIIFDFSDSSRPKWYLFANRNNEFEHYDFPDASKTLDRKDILFFKNIDLAAMATKYNGGRKAISSRGGKAKKGAKYTCKTNPNASRQIRVKLEINSANNWDVKELTLVDAYKIITKWGYKGQYKSLSQTFRRNGYFKITNELSRIEITALDAGIIDYSSLGVTPNTLNNIILKGNLNESINLKENSNVKLSGVTSNPKNYNNNPQTINEALFPENFKEVKTQKKQLKKSDKEYSEKSTTMKQN